MTRSVTFWQNLPSIHQSAMIRALASMPAYRVTLVTADDVPPGRSRMGWVEPDFGAVIRVHKPTAVDATRLILSNADYESVHIFSGISAYPVVYRGISKAIRTDATIGVLAEAADGRGLRGWIRRVLYHAHALRYSSDIDFLLTMGATGLRWYSRSGFDPERLFPFGYFVEGPKEAMLVSRSPDPTFTIVYVGQLYPGKGVDLLLSALGSLRELQWRLDVLGDGSARGELEHQAGMLGIADRVRWLGFQPNGRVYEVLNQCDLLVLPSRYDGWGAVVNEALLVGVPIVCSDACGAADLVVGPRQGNVVRAEDLASLTAAIRQRVAAGKLAVGDREALSAWSRCITGESGAGYLAAILDHHLKGSRRPTPPWLQTE